MIKLQDIVSIGGLSADCSPKVVYNMIYRCAGHIRMQRADFFKFAIDFIGEFLLMPVNSPGIGYLNGLD